MKDQSNYKIGNVASNTVLLPLREVLPDSESLEDYLGTHSKKLQGQQCFAYHELGTIEDPVQMRGLCVEFKRNLLLYPY